MSGQTVNNAFYINPSTGVLSLQQKLRYEDTNDPVTGIPRGYHLLVIEASDNGVPPLTSNVTVKVNVIDQNNHSPKLEQNRFMVQISELAPEGTFIGNVTATDEDGGEFGRITYRLGSGSDGNFRVDPVTGIVTVAKDRSFDFESKSRYDFVIFATDGGAPQLNDTAMFRVILQNANNKAPLFSSFFYRTTISEGWYFFKTFLAFFFNLIMCIMNISKILGCLKG